jgi:hypothetical protein
VSEQPRVVDVDNRDIRGHEADLADDVRFGRTFGDDAAVSVDVRAGEGAEEPCQNVMTMAAMA